MIFNISQIKDYLACPAKHHFRHVLRRGLPGPKSDALELGSLVHAAMEAKLLGRPLPTSSDPVYGKLLPHLTKWPIPKDWKIIAVEQPMSVLLDSKGDTLFGTLDAIVQWNGGFWSLQWKTCSAATSLPSYAESVRVGWYECAYHWMAEQLGHTPFMGTILVTIKKLSAASLDRGTNPMALHYLPRSKAMVTKRMADLSAIIQKIKDNPAPEQNPDSCFAYNSRCPYWTTCHEGADIQGPEFIGIKPRYEVPP